MAPRRNREASLDYDSNRFGGPNEQKLFDTTWSRRNVLAERALELDDFSIEDFNLKKNIIDRGWGIFVSLTGNAVVPLVQEFFSNVVEHERSDEKKIITSMVRKKPITLTPRSVTDCFEIPEIENEPEYPMSIRNSQEKDEIARILTGKPNARWGSRSQFETSKLSRIYNTLFLLSITKFKPLAHKNLVSYERALLLYAIEKGMTIDLPLLVWEEISNTIQQTHGTASLPFGSFLTALFGQKGVQVSGDMEIVRSIGPICERTIVKSTTLLKKKKVSEDHDRQHQILMRMDDIEANQWTIIEQNKLLLDYLQHQFGPPQPNMPPPPSEESN